jgi:Ser/Thr protein kinase RdoA (MazF antagonist)
MSNEPLELASAAVLKDYWLFDTTIQRSFLENACGFSGSHIWQIRRQHSAHCLKAWPLPFQDSDLLNRLHRWMLHAFQFENDWEFVPEVHPRRNGQTWIRYSGRLWDLTQWMPGQAHFHANPSLPRLKAACRALAQLHEAWSSESILAVPPSVQRRLESARKWEEAARAGWRPTLTPYDLDPVSPIASRIWALLPPFLPEIEIRLPCWTAPRTLQPCLCDIWHDHVLFTGDKVTGIIDYGSMRLDTAAADLARMLGSLVGDDLEMWNAGFAAYREVRPLDEAEATLARVLDWTGVVLGAANWLHRLYIENRVYEDRERVARRMQELVERMEFFASSPLWGKAYRCL